MAPATASVPDSGPTAATATGPGTSTPGSARSRPGSRSCAPARTFPIGCGSWVEPDEVSSPYDLRLSKTSSAYRKVWGDRVVARLKEPAGPLAERRSRFTQAQRTRHPFASCSALPEPASPSHWRVRHLAHVCPGNSITRLNTLTSCFARSRSPPICSSQIRMSAARTCNLMKRSGSVCSTGDVAVGSGGG